MPSEYLAVTNPSTRADNEGWTWHLRTRVAAADSGCAACVGPGIGQHVDQLDLNGHAGHENHIQQGHQ